MQNPETIALIAAFFTMIGYLPQAIKTIQTRDTKSISFWMYFLSFVGVVFWLIYGFMVHSGAIIFKNISVIILSGVILLIKTSNIIKYKEDIKDLNIKNKILRKILNKR